MSFKCVNCSMLTLMPAFYPAGTTALANVTVWSTKKNDRGRFNVYIGQTLLVSADCYMTKPCYHVYSYDMTF